MRAPRDRPEACVPRTWAPFDVPRGCGCGSAHPPPSPVRAEFWPTGGGTGLSPCPASSRRALLTPGSISPFRWCPTYPDYFAVSTGSPAKGAVIHVHNVSYPHAQPTAFDIAQRPLYVRSFDFVACRGIPRIVAAVGRDIVVFYIGVDT